MPKKLGNSELNYWYGIACNNITKTVTLTPDKDIDNGLLIITGYQGSPSTTTGELRQLVKMHSSHVDCGNDMYIYSVKDVKVNSKISVPIRGGAYSAHCAVLVG